MSKKVVYSGIQPSGNLTLGNYLGALSNFSELQEEYDCIYCIVDMHAVTAYQDPKSLRKNTLDVLALYLAAGIDPEKSIIYIQSHVPEHAELAWLLNTVTSVGQLNRMTQFKDKSKKQTEVLAGILNYPILMAADILLYQTSFVPVGEDQRQHIELTRDLAQKFNSRYSPTFELPDILTPKVGARIMSLQNPQAKMSKSDEDVNSFILILDDENTIKRKIKRAVTDSIGVIDYNYEQKGLKNLIDIYAACTGLTPAQIVEEYKDKGYGDLKEGTAIAVVEKLRPVRERYEEIISDKEKLKEIYTLGAQKASYAANKTLRKVYKKMGFIPKG